MLCYTVLYCALPNFSEYSIEMWCIVLCCDILYTTLLHCVKPLLKSDNSIHSINGNNKIF
jgi:hypothetical protein